METLCMCIRMYRYRSGLRGWHRIQAEIAYCRIQLRNANIRRRKTVQQVKSSLIQFQFFVFLVCKTDRITSLYLSADLKTTKTYVYECVNRLEPNSRKSFTLYPLSRTRLDSNRYEYVTKYLPVTHDLIKCFYDLFILNIFNGKTFLSEHSSANNMNDFYFIIFIHVSGIPRNDAAQQYIV